MSGKVVAQRISVNFRWLHTAAARDPRDFLSIPCIVDYRHASLAHRVKVRPAVYFAVGLGLKARVLIGSSHAVEIGVCKAVLYHEFVNVHPNYLSNPSSLSILLLGGVMPW